MTTPKDDDDGSANRAKLIEMRKARIERTVAVELDALADELAAAIDGMRAILLTWRKSGNDGARVVRRMRELSKALRKEWGHE